MNRPHKIALSLTLLTCLVTADAPVNAARRGVISAYGRPPGGARTAPTTALRGARNGGARNGGQRTVAPRAARTVGGGPAGLPASGPRPSASVRPPKLTGPGGARPAVPRAAGVRPSAGRAGVRVAPRRFHTHGRAVIGAARVGACITAPAVAASVAVVVSEPAVSTVVVETPAPPEFVDAVWTVQRVLAVDRVALEQGGRLQQVRLLGVTPSSIQPERCAAGLAELAQGKQVHLVFDAAVAEQDEEGVTIAYLFRAHDQSLLNLEAIQQGWALATAGYEYHHAALFAAAQQQARSAGVGLWP